MNQFSGPWPLRRITVSSADEVVPAGLFDDHIEFESIDPSTVSLNDIDPRERALVANAVETRQREFAAGRVCARRALSRFDAPEAPLLADADRIPRWPEGFVGTISHVHDFCGVAVGRRARLAGVGFDIEPSLALPADAWRIVLTDDERASLSALPDRDRGVRARLIFSAKEAFYKCYRSAGGGWLDFSDVELRLTPDSDDIDLRVKKQLGVNAPRIEGRYAITPRFIFTAFTAR